MKVLEGPSIDQFKKVRSKLCLLPRGLDFQEQIGDKQDSCLQDAAKFSLARTSSDLFDFTTAAVMHPHTWNVDSARAWARRKGFKEKTYEEFVVFVEVVQSCSVNAKELQVTDSLHEIYFGHHQHGRILIGLYA